MMNHMTRRNIAMKKSERFIIRAGIDLLALIGAARLAYNALKTEVTINKETKVEEPEYNINIKYHSNATHSDLIKEVPSKDEKIAVNVLYYIAYPINGIKTGISKLKEIIKNKNTKEITEE